MLVLGGADVDNVFTVIVQSASCLGIAKLIYDAGKARQKLDDVDNRLTRIEDQAGERYKRLDARRGAWQDRPEKG